MEEITINEPRLRVVHRGMFYGLIGGLAAGAALWGFGEGVFHIANNAVNLMNESMGSATFALGSSGIGGAVIDWRYLRKQKNIAKTAIVSPLRVPGEDQLIEESASSL